MNHEPHRSTSGFKDHFSARAAAYATFRPTYPAELVDFLADLAPARDLAWDCGCGSGRLSVGLARRFASGVATDASAHQLAQAAGHPRVEYRKTAAERSGLPDGCVDLAVAAQAVHWFDLPAYYAEVRRVAKAGGFLALVTYAAMSVGPELDPVLRGFHARRLARYWPPERRWVEEGYRSLPFPFAELAAPRFEMRRTWTLEQLLGYVATWSAVRALEEQEGHGDFEAVHRRLAARWGEPSVPREVRWPLWLRVGRV